MARSISKAMQRVHRARLSACVSFRALHTILSERGCSDAGYGWTNALCKRLYNLLCGVLHGRLLTSTLTDVPGSSAYVMGSVVSYSNDVKSRILHVAEENACRARCCLSGDGAGNGRRGYATSCRQMSASASRGSPVPAAVLPKSRSDWSTLLYLLWEKLRWKKNVFSGVRAEIKRAAVNKALAMVQEMIREMDE